MTIKRTPSLRARRERDTLTTGASLDLNQPTRDILDLTRTNATGSTKLDVIPQSSEWISAAYYLDTHAGGASKNFTPSTDLVVDGASADDCAQIARLEMLESRAHLFHNNPDSLTRSCSKRRAKDLIRNSANKSKYVRDLFQRANTPTPPTGDSNYHMLLALGVFSKSLDSVNEQILGMLYNGMTQQSMADQLGISQPAVAKRIKKLSHQLVTWVAQQSITY